MTNYFFIDEKNNVYKSYDDLLKDINDTKELNSLVDFSEYYEIFKAIIISIIYEKKIIILDNELSEIERKLLLEETDIPNNSYVLDKKFETIGNILEAVYFAQSWELTLFTSGTTGKPKMVKHNIKSLCRQVKTGEKYRENIWGYAYHPSHIAGIQVFLQALFNQNLIIRLFGIPGKMITKLIETYNITHLSATPTFYRLLLTDNIILDKVLRISVGGERFDSHTMEKIKKMFPNAKILNIYASTEAGTIFASKGDTFTVREGDDNFIRIVNGELQIHEKLLGDFDRSKNFQDHWYSTGDLVEIEQSQPLKFKIVSRKSEMINVGGYKVNPGEVENCIREMPEVKEVRVFGKKNSVVGNIICAEIIIKSGNISETDIRHFLLNKLQDFKIPRVIRFVDSFNLTHTGKLKRA